MKKHIRVVLTAVAALAVLAAAVLAAGEYSGPAGSETDPLVTMSYIDRVFTDYVQRLFREEMGKQTDSLRDSLEKRVSALEEAAGKAGNAALSFREISLDSGRELICKAGTELLLRVGSAGVLSADASGLVDTSSEAEPVSGEYIKANHMYLVTADGCGVRANGYVTLLVRGDYEIR